MTKGKARRGFIVWIALILLSTQSVCAEGKTESIQPAAVQEAADAEEQLTQSVYEKRYQREALKLLNEYRRAHGVSARSCRKQRI